MIFALIGWIIALALFGLVLSVGPWQKIILKGLEILLVEAQIAIKHFRKIVFWVTWFLVIDHVLLLIFVISDMHTAIITWAAINCLFYWIMVEITRAKIIQRFRQPLGYFFLIFAVAGIAELFLPGLLKHGAWWFLGVVVIPLIIGQVFTLSQFKSAGFLGLKVLLTWIIFFSILALGNRFGDKFFTKLLLNYDISNMDSDYVTWVRVVAKTGVYEMHKSGLGPFEDIDMVKTKAFPVNIGDTLAMPVSKYNYDGGGMPSFVWNLSKFIPVVEVLDDYFGNSKYWIKAQSVKIIDNPYLSTLDEKPMTEKVGDSIHFEKMYNLKEGIFEVLNETGQAPRAFYHFSPEDKKRLYRVDAPNSVPQREVPESLNGIRIKLNMPAKGTISITDVPKSNYLDGKFRVYQNGKEVLN